MRTLLGRDADADLVGAAAVTGRRRIAGHLADCASCRSWREQLAFFGRAVSGTALPPPADLADRVLAASRRSGRRRARWLVLARALLVAVAGAGLVLAAPALTTGADSDYAIHAAHEIGAVDVALCLGLLAAALWPHRARGVLAVVASAAALLAVTAGCDIADGYTSLWHEADHSVVVVGAALVWWLSRLVPETAPPARRGADAEDSAEDGDGATLPHDGTGTPARVRAVA